MNNAIKTDLTGGLVPNARRIAAWEDGNFDNLIVKFWEFSGSIMRSVYNRRTTQRTEEFLNVHSEEYARMRAEYC